MKKAALFVLVLLLAVNAEWAWAAAVPPPIGLTLSINDGAPATVYRGWPLVITGQVYLKGEVDAEVTLDSAALQLAIGPSRGPAEGWPVRRMTELAGPLVLGPRKNFVRIVWLVTAEQSSRIAAGSYTATLSWAGKKSPPVNFSMADAPGNLSAPEQERKARWQSEAALLLGDGPGALAALQGEGAPLPESVSLLMQRARVHEQQGNHAGVLAATQRAQEIFHQKYPDADHPPVSILTVQARALAALLNAHPAGTRKVTPTTTTGGISVTDSPAPLARAIEVKPVVSAVTPTPTALARPPVPLIPAPQMAVSAAPAEPPPGKVVPTTELSDGKIRADAAGQWAATATAGSSYSKPNYGPAKATGVPDVGVAGDSIDAWCPGQQNSGTDWLEVAFAKPTPSIEVRVRQNHNPGTIVKVEAIATDGTTHLWWEGKDPYVAPAVRDFAWFAVRVPATSYAVAKIKLTLNLAAAPGWKQIDAVQLVAAP